MDKPRLIVIRGYLRQADTGLKIVCECCDRAPDACEACKAVTAGRYIIRAIGLLSDVIGAPGTLREVAAAALAAETP